MRKDLGNILGAVTGDNADNHIVRAMQPIYAKAALIKGKAGTPKQRAQIFEQDVTSMGNGAWIKAHELMEKELNGFLMKHAEALTKASEAFFGELLKKFHIMCSAKEVDDPEEIELREQLEKTLILAREKLDTEVRSAADALFGAP